MYRALMCGMGVLLMALHARAAPTGLANASAADSGDTDLANFLMAYLAGFLASCAWLAWRAWRHLRSDVKALRGRA